MNYAARRERAVSPVTGVALLIGVTVVLSVLILTSLYGAFDPSDPAKAAVSIDQDGYDNDDFVTGQEVSVQLIATDDVDEVIVRPAGSHNPVCNAERTLTEDDRIAEYNGCSVGDEFSVVAVSGSEQTRISTFEIE